MSSILENQSESESSIRLPVSRLLQLHSDTSQEDLTDRYVQDMTLQKKPISLGLVLKESEKAKTPLKIEEESPQQNQQYTNVKLPRSLQDDSKVFDEDNEKKL